MPRGLACVKLQGAGNLYLPKAQAEAFGFEPDGEATLFPMIPGVMAFAPGRVQGHPAQLSQAIAGTAGAVRIRLRKHLMKLGINTLEQPRDVEVRFADEDDLKHNPGIPVGRAMVVDVRPLIPEPELP